jgi:hypothetical protein
MVEPKISRNIHLASNPTASGVPTAVGHGIRGGANGRLPFGQIPAAVGHSGRNPSAVAHGGRVMAPWATAATPPLYKGATAAAAGPPSLTPSSKSTAFNPSKHF